MAWDTTLVTSLKYYLEPTAVSDYTDEQLKQFILIGANETFLNLGLFGTYQVDFSGSTITPDPSLDNGVTALIIVRSALIIARSELKKYALTAGYMIQDDRSKIDGANMLKALQEFIKSLEKLFKDASADYQSNNGLIGTAILAPYTRGNYGG